MMYFTCITLPNSHNSLFWWIVLFHARGVKSWASPREGHSTRKWQSKNLNLELPDFRHALLLVNQWMSARLLHRYLGSCVHVHDLKNREEKKNQSSERCFLPLSPFIHLQSGIFHRTWEAVRGCGEGYWFVLNASHEWFSLLSLPHKWRLAKQM